MGQQYGYHSQPIYLQVADIVNPPKPPERRLARPIAAWITEGDYARLKQVSDAKGVTMASFIRGVLIDAIEDELVNQTLPTSL